MARTCWDQKGQPKMSSSAQSSQSRNLPASYGNTMSRETKDILLRLGSEWTGEHGDCFHCCQGFSSSLSSPACGTIKGLGPRPPRPVDTRPRKHIAHPHGTEQEAPSLEVFPVSTRGSQRHNAAPCGSPGARLHVLDADQGA